MRRYSVNMRNVIDTHLCVLGYYDAINVFRFLGMLYMSYKVYKKCERFLGKKVLQVISMKI